jgi:hypothetical protein
MYFGFIAFGLCETVLLMLALPALVTATLVLVASKFHRVHRLRHGVQGTLHNVKRAARSFDVACVIKLSRGQRSRSDSFQLRTTGLRVDSFCACVMGQEGRLQELQGHATGFNRVACALIRAQFVVHGDLNHCVALLISAARYGVQMLHVQISSHGRSLFSV